LEDEFLFIAPFQVTAGGPIRDISLADSEALSGESSDDVFVRNAVPEHVVNHVALGFREAGDAAVAPGLIVLNGGRQGFGFDNGY